MDEVFRVPGFKWLGIFAKISDEANIIVSIPQKGFIIWEVLPDLSGVRKLFVFWSEGYQQCFIRNRTTSSGACLREAKMEYFDDGSPFDLYGQIGRIVSPNPDKFLIFSSCASEARSCKGLCTTGFTAVFVKDQRVTGEGDILLDGILWCEIEQTLNDCFDMSLSNSSFGQIMQYALYGPGMIYDYRTAMANQHDKNLQLEKKIIILEERLKTAHENQKAAEEAAQKTKQDLAHNNNLLRTMTDYVPGIQGKLETIDANTKRLVDIVSEVGSSHNKGGLLKRALTNESYVPLDSRTVKLVKRN